MTPALNPLIVSDLKSISLSCVLRGFGLNNKSSVCLNVIDLSSDVKLTGSSRALACEENPVKAIASDARDCRIRFSVVITKLQCCNPPVRLLHLFPMVRVPTVNEKPSAKNEAMKKENNTAETVDRLNMVHATFCASWRVLMMNFERMRMRKAIMRKTYTVSTVCSGRQDSV